MPELVYSVAEATDQNSHSGKQPDFGPVRQRPALTPRSLSVGLYVPQIHEGHEQGGTPLHCCCGTELEAV